jgi:hypothetical protein
MENLRLTISNRTRFGLLTIDDDDADPAIGLPSVEECSSSVPGASASAKPGDTGIALGGESRTGRSSAPVKPGAESHVRGDSRLGPSSCGDGTIDSCGGLAGEPQSISLGSLSGDGRTGWRGWGAVGSMTGPGPGPLGSINDACTSNVISIAGKPICFPLLAIKSFCDLARHIFSLFKASI